MLEESKALTATAKEPVAAVDGAVSFLALLGNPSITDALVSAKTCDLNVRSSAEAVAAPESQALVDMVKRSRELVATQREPALTLVESLVDAAKFDSVPSGAVEAIMTSFPVQGLWKMSRAYEACWRQQVHSLGFRV